MPNIISAKKNYPVFDEYISAISQYIHIVSNHVKYSQNVELSYENILLGYFPAIISNKKIIPYSQCAITYSPFTSDNFTKLGHLYSESFHCIQAMDFDSNNIHHVEDIVNAMLFSMKYGPEYSLCLMQVLAFFYTLYTDNINITIATDMGELNSYEL